MRCDELRLGLKGPGLKLAFYCISLKLGLAGPNLKRLGQAFSVLRSGLDPANEACFVRSLVPLKLLLIKNDFFRLCMTIVQKTLFCTIDQSFIFYVIVV